MCGRFTRKTSVSPLAERFGLPALPALPPRFNIAPSQTVACLRTNLETGQYELVEMQWGLVPSWAKDPSIGRKLANARGETVAEKPSFRKAFKQQRCLILADGYYEWKAEGKGKQPYYIRFKDQRLFAFAGLWESWDKQGPALETCCLITTTPNALLKPIHHRMPVILEAPGYVSWLRPSLNNTMYLTAQFMHPYEREEELEVYPVSTLVNNPRNDAAACIQPMT